MLEKTRPVKLHGKNLFDLNIKIHERDNNCCIVCGAYVDPGIKFHHEPCGAGNKSDEIDKGVTLCNKHHHERHFGKDTTKIKRKIIDYLANFYS